MTEQQTVSYLIDDQSLVKPDVQLVGQDSNAFSILGRVMKAWKRMGRPDIAEEFQKRATSGDYNNLLAMAMEYVDEDAAWGEDEEEEEDGDDEEFYEGADDAFYQGEEG